MNDDDSDHNGPALETYQAVTDSVPVVPTGDSESEGGSTFGLEVETVEPQQQGDKDAEAVGSIENSVKQMTMDSPSPPPRKDIWDLTMHKLHRATSDGSLRKSVLVVNMAKRLQVNSSGEDESLDVVDSFDRCDTEVPEGRNEYHTQHVQSSPDYYQDSALTAETTNCLSTSVATDDAASLEIGAVSGLPSSFTSSSSDSGLPTMVPVFTTATAMQADADAAALVYPSACSDYSLEIHSLDGMDMITGMPSVSREPVLANLVPMSEHGDPYSTVCRPVVPVATSQAPQQMAQLREECLKTFRIMRGGCDAPDQDSVMEEVGGAVPCGFSADLRAGAPVVTNDWQAACFQ